MKKKLHKLIKFTSFVLHPRFLILFILAIVIGFQSVRTYKKYFLAHSSIIIDPTDSQPLTGTSQKLQITDVYSSGTPDFTSSTIGSKLYNVGDDVNYSIHYRSR